MDTILLSDASEDVCEVEVEQMFGNLGDQRVLDMPGTDQHMCLATQGR